MGKFYVNFSVKSSDQQQVVAVLRDAGRVAIVSPPQAGYVVVYDEETDRQALASIVLIGNLLSQSLNVSVLGTLNHDDRILRYWLFEAGAIVDAYDSRPDYFNKFFLDLNEEDDDEMKDIDTTQISRPEKLKDCLKLNIDLAKVKKILRNKYPLETIRHQAFATELGLPHWSVGVGYYDVEKLKKAIAKDNQIDLKDETFVQIG
ncbi:MAG: hypothetical protein NT070_08820 [Cyanobacteria bacterium]|nr:hypothetical protein [Cyanobacteriota bacterium]